jgi:hypothetical protein
VALPLLAAHIRVAPVGQAGPVVVVVVQLFTQPVNAATVGPTCLTDLDKNLLKASIRNPHNDYVNVHNTLPQRRGAWPAGLTQQPTSRAAAGLEAVGRTSARPGRALAVEQFTRQVARRHRKRWRRRWIAGACNTQDLGVLGRLLAGQQRKQMV